MKIQLPDDFKYKNKSERGEAYVKDGILYEDSVSFEALMRAITYTLKGIETCFYCQRNLTCQNWSLDHMFPRRWGGVSIPDNLVPSCMECNGEKRDMTFEQFMEYRKIETPEKREEYYAQCERKNHRTLQRAKFVIERDWIQVYSIEELIKTVKFSKFDKRKYGKVAAYYRKHGQYPHPLILSGNGRVLKGKHMLYHAKTIGRKSLIAIVLENVIVLEEGIP